MILHSVYCDFRADAADAQRNDVLEALAQFSEALEGVLGFDFGPNRDFEGKSARFDAGFVIRFADREAVEAYALHPTHQKLGARLCELCNGGAEGIMVFDLEV
ncbi:Dabb family protein [Aliiroseovarius sp. 2305UL8-7]|uniref:Dabb family protein n=1 Tax=Aliiroseovarius conchicola TaxID=3121637 RepID=UPI003527429E